MASDETFDDVLVLRDKVRPGVKPHQLARHSQLIYERQRSFVGTATGNRTGARNLDIENAFTKAPDNHGWLFASIFVTQGVCMRRRNFVRTCQSTVLLCRSSNR